MQKKFISVLLTLLMMAGVIAVAPVMASAAGPIEVSNATEFKDAIDNAQDGDTIKLLANINYSSYIGIMGMTITFDLNGKTLNTTGGFWVDDGGELLLAKPISGAFNVSDSGNNDSALWVNGKAEVTSVTASGADMWAVDLKTGEVVVYGNVTQTTGSDGCGVLIVNSGKVTIDGILTVATGATYVDFDGTAKTQADFTTTTKTGYLTYTDNGSTVWVKCQAHTFGTAWLNDATNHWHAACSKCGAADTPAAHTASDWVTTLEPTTTTPGSRQKKCTVCQAVTATEAIAMVKAVGLFGMNTTYPSNFLNWFLFIVCFGFIWMWFF